MTMIQKEKEMNKSTEKSEILPELFLGRILLEIIKEDSSNYKKEQYGLTDDSPLKGFQIVDGEIDKDTGELKVKSHNSVPYKKGKIIKMASSAFGERFQYYYGKDNVAPKVGDVVMFIPNQSYRVDAAGKYHIITDEHIIAYYKGENNE